METSAKDETPKPTTKVEVDAETQRLLERAQRQGDVAKDLGGTTFEGCEQKNVEDILDCQYALVEVRIAKGRYGEYAIMHFIHPVTRAHISVATGGQVVVRKVQELQEKRQIPSLVTVVKVKDYYDLV